MKELETIDAETLYNQLKETEFQEFILRSDDNSDKCDNKLKFFKENNDNRKTLKNQEM